LCRQLIPENGSGTLQEFVTKVAERVVAVDPATPKWADAVLPAAFFGAVPFGLFQY
jgi:hypothetical protein